MCKIVANSNENLLKTNAIKDGKVFKPNIKVYFKSAMNKKSKNFSDSLKLRKMNVMSICLN